LELINPVFPEFVAADNVWTTSVNNVNPIVHPPMVLFNAGRIEATGGNGWNLYADGATECVTQVMMAMDAERMALLGLVSNDGVAFKDTVENFYTKYSLGKKTLSECLRKSPIHGNPLFRHRHALIHGTSTRICRLVWPPGLPSAVSGVCPHPM